MHMRDVCVLRVYGEGHADGARVGDARQTRRSVCAEGDGRPGSCQLPALNLLLTRYLPINWLSLGHYLYLVNSQLCSFYQLTGY